MINYDLRKVKAVIFDIDGVLSAETIGMDSDGMPVRTMNIKDGYAIQLAMKMGLRVAIMTGGDSEAIRGRYAYLGVEDIYMKCAVKIETYNKFIKKYGLHDDEIIFMGDDIPDYEIMQRVGCPCCPADACPEVKNISVYVSQKRGGFGCARDVLEQVMQAQGLWLSSAKAFGW
ncbi:3-deoxy-D-manno-octulosonate 8-phosphate phosphatase, YrbI family [Bacteroidales bacterium KA00344]|nr:3-deoxy-D-manno-octulosonate 8-phosphate phosphatase, YrbI family [Bacteroidales bacterium KA00344]